MVSTRRSLLLKRNTKQEEKEEANDSDEEVEQLLAKGNDDDDDDDEEEEEESGDEEMEVEEEDDDENDESEEDDDDEEMEDDEPVEIKPMASATGEQCTFDLYNLLALNTHQVDIAKLYSKPKKSSIDEDVTIPAENMPVTVDEAHLLEKATDGCMQLINALWQLPTERSDAGPLVVLPGYSESKLPRQLVRKIPAAFSSAGLVLDLTSLLYSLLHHPRRIQNGKSLPRSVVCLSTKPNDPRRFGTKPKTTGSFVTDSTRQTTMPRNGPLWKSSPTTTPLRIHGSLCAILSVVVKIRIW
jgi:hypothetical protein